MIKLDRLMFQDLESQEYMTKWFTSEEAAEAEGQRIVKSLDDKDSPWSWTAISEVIIPTEKKNITHLELTTVLNEHAIISPYGPPKIH